MIYYNEFKLALYDYPTVEDRENFVNNKLHSIEKEHNEIISVVPMKMSDSIVYGITYRYE